MADAVAAKLPDAALWRYRPRLPRGQYFRVAFVEHCHRKIDLGCFEADLERAEIGDRRVELEHQRAQLFGIEMAELEEAV